LISSTEFNFFTFFADGDDWIQLFKCDEKLLTSDIALGDVIEVEGTTVLYYFFLDK